MNNWRDRTLKSMKFQGMLLPVLSLLLALAVSAIPIMLAGKNPLLAYYEMLLGSVGGQIRIGVSLTKATPLLFTGLSVALAFRSGLFSIGAEGQLYMGALGGTMAALYLPGLPKPLLITASILAGFVFGAIWGLIPGYLKARHNTNEIITTIMLNYIAFWFISFLVHGPLREPSAMFSYTYEVPDAAKLPILIKGTQLHAGFLLALALVFLTYVLIKHTSLGFQLRSVGSNPEASHYAGMNISRNILVTMALSGGLAGLAGVTEIIGVQYRLSDFFSPGFGYDGIAVALLGANTPGGVLFASLFFGMLRAGASVMQRRIGVPSYTALIIQGLAVFFVVIGFGIRMLRAEKQSKITVMEGPQ